MLYDAASMFEIQTLNVVVLKVPKNAMHDFSLLRTDAATPKGADKSFNRK